MPTVRAIEQLPVTIESLTLSSADRASLEALGRRDLPRLAELNIHQGQLDAELARRIGERDWPLVHLALDWTHVSHRAIERFARRPGLRQLSLGAELGKATVPDGLVVVRHTMGREFEEKRLYFDDEKDQDLRELYADDENLPAVPESEPEKPPPIPDRRLERRFEDRFEGYVRRAPAKRSWLRSLLGR
jgi:hypothetical protein